MLTKSFALIYTGACAAILDDAKDVAREPLSVILLAGMIILGIVIAAQDKRRNADYKAFADQVQKEREERNDERKKEHEALVKIVAENTAAFTAFKAVLEQLAHRR